MVQRPFLDDALAFEEGADRVEPALVVRGGEVLLGRHRLDGVPELVEVEDGSDEQRALEREDARLPVGVEGFGVTR